MLEKMAPIKLKSTFKLSGLIEVNFKVNLNNKKKIESQVITVANAAPYKLNLGINIKFKITLIIAPNKVAQKIFFCWPEAISKR